MIVNEILFYSDTIFPNCRDHYFYDKFILGIY